MLITRSRALMVSWLSFASCLDEAKSTLLPEWASTWPASLPLKSGRIGTAMRPCATAVKKARDQLTWPLA